MLVRMVSLCVAASCDCADVSSTIGDGLKQALSAQENSINDAHDPEARAQSKAELARLYYKDQQQEKALRTYLDALDIAVPIPPPPAREEEKQLYDRAMTTYLNNKELHPREVASSLKKEFQPYIERHPDAYLLTFIVATADANLDNFDAFFPLFLKSYSHYPTHYFSYKTRGLLHIKLFEKLSVGSQRESERQLVIENLEQALKQIPEDTALYRMILAFVPEDQKKDAVERYLKSIMDNNIEIPRGEILFYVQQAVSVNDCAIAQQFVDYAKKWYPYSRAINGAQFFLDQHVQK